jgi:hypothetical protein
MIYPLAFLSRQAVGPTQTSVQWVLGVLSQEIKRGRGVTLTTHPHLVLRSWMGRSYTSSPPQAPPWRVAGLLYLFIFHVYQSTRKNLIMLVFDRLCGLVVSIENYKHRGPGFDSRDSLGFFWGSWVWNGATQPRDRINWVVTWIKK